MPEKDCVLIIKEEEYLLYVGKLKWKKGKQTFVEDKIKSIRWAALAYIPLKQTILKKSNIQEYYSD